MEKIRTEPSASLNPSPTVLAVASGGAAYAFAGPAVIAAQIPVTTTTAPSSETTVPPPPAQEPSAPTDNSGLITILGLAAFVGAIVAIIVKGKKPAVR